MKIIKGLLILILISGLVSFIIYFEEIEEFIYIKKNCEVEYYDNKNLKSSYCKIEERYLYMEFYSNDSIKYVYYADLNHQISGPTIKFYANGNSQENVFYKNGKKDGLLQSFNEEGVLEVEEVYRLDSLLNRNEYNYDSLGNIESIRRFGYKRDFQE